MKKPLSILLINLLFCGIIFAQKGEALIYSDNATGQLSVSDSNKNLIIKIHKDDGCFIESMNVMGNEVLNAEKGASTGFGKNGKTYSSSHSNKKIIIAIKDNELHISGISFGEKDFYVDEEWIFTVKNNSVQWNIRRIYSNGGTMERNLLPSWTFGNMQTWNGAILNNGGVAWCKFLEKENMTYGAHASGMTFWNRKNNFCLRVTSAIDKNLYGATSFSHIKNNLFEVTQTYSPIEVSTKYGLRRFIETGQDVFAPVSVIKSIEHVTYNLQALLYDQAYDRGELKGINESSVNEMLNTIARYSVVDQNLFGSNGWRTGWAVLQEQWLALFGLAIDDPGYIKGFSQTLEYEKEHAILPDGRVLPRWHHDATDAMPNTFTKEGYYECMWGYMLDAQPAYAIDVAEQFDMTGDIEWLRKFKPACEKALDYMIRRDEDHDGLFEVMTKTHKEQKGTDWLDVIWASHEVATINALMYLALDRWTELEKLLGDNAMSDKYKMLAAKLKSSYNKDIKEGGFWNPDKNWYVHWREPDNSVYGNNFVSVVNFMAIGYGICDDPARKDAILNNMESLMQRENLFIWPSCFYPYEENVGLIKIGDSPINYPYPNYENGDMFLGWAELGTRCYAEKNPGIALKYINNVIAKYEQDGLAHQRYKRADAEGAGDDILANNANAIVGLYRNIYGIRPQYNRLYIEPHLTPELYGTRLKYQLRNNNYLIEYKDGNIIVKCGNFTISSAKPFAVNPANDQVEIFAGMKVSPLLKAKCSSACTIEITNVDENKISWNQIAPVEKTKIAYELCGLKTDKQYSISVNNTLIKTTKPDALNKIAFESTAGKTKSSILIEVK